MLNNLHVQIAIQDLIAKLIIIMHAYQVFIKIRLQLVHAPKFQQDSTAQIVRRHLRLVQLEHILMMTKLAV